MSPWVPQYKYGGQRLLVALTARYEQRGLQGVSSLMLLAPIPIKKILTICFYRPFRIQFRPRKSELGIYDTSLLTYNECTDYGIFHSCWTTIIATRDRRVCHTSYISRKIVIRMSKTAVTATTTVISTIWIFTRTIPQSMWTCRAG